MATPKAGIPKQSKLFYGADYNPAQWQHAPEILEHDIKLMKQAGVPSASVGIFSWTALEPEEGRTTFGWLDRVMDRFAQEGPNRHQPERTVRAEETRKLRKMP